MLRLLPGSLTFMFLPSQVIQLHFSPSLFDDMVARNVNSEADFQLLFDDLCLRCDVTFTVHHALDTKYQSMKDMPCKFRMEISLSLSVCQSFCLSVCLSVCPSLSLSFSSSLFPSFSPPLSPSPPPLYLLGLFGFPPQKKDTSMVNDM